MSFNSSDIQSFKNVWVFCEQRQGVMMPTTFELISEGRKLANELGVELCGILLGDNVKGIAAELGQYGADKVYVYDSPLLKDFTTDAYTKVLVEAVEELKPEVLLFGASNIGRDLAPRCAARLHTGLCADCTHLDIDMPNYKGFLKEASTLPEERIEKLGTVKIAGQDHDVSRDLKMTRPAFGGHLMASIICPRFRPAMAVSYTHLPNDIVAQYGADTMRLHIMFIGDFEKAVSWSNEAVKGSKRFLDRCFNLQDIATDEEGISAKNEAVVHKTIKKVSQDIDELKMNTAIAAMMTMVNEFYANGCSKGDVEMLCLLLSPFAPHMVEEMWENMGFAARYGKMAMQMDWPAHDEAKTVDSHVEMAVQVNGKLKGTVNVPMDSDEAAVVAAAMDVDKVKKATEGMSVVKTILVKNKLVNLIVKPAK